MTRQLPHHGGAPRSYLAGLIGHGVKPSLTPEMHEREAARHGIRYVYKTVDLTAEVPQQRLRELLDAAVELGFDGLNVTHPVKQAMVPLVDEVTDAVAAIGALNTILVRDGRTSGHNTDVTGFERSFREGLPDAALTQVVLLGAGGAGTAVAHALARLSVRHLVVVDPDAARADRLVRSLPPGLDLDVATALPQDVPDVIAAASGLVNATPLGMAAHPGPPLDVALLRPDLWVADIVYRPVVTELLHAARTRGCQTLPGTGMAVHQAADAFELITGREADRSAMAADLADMVSAEEQAALEPAHATPQGRKQ